MAIHDLSELVAGQDRSSLRIERNLLKDQILELLRERIITGRLAPGTPLVEKDLAELLGVSRIPVRDALMQLEAEGLVVSKPSGRCVIELTERDINELYQVRLVLERLAVSLATRNIDAAGKAILRRKAQEMANAIAQNDRASYRRNDVETHRLIWEISGNAHLAKVLQTMVGPIFMLVARHAEHFDWSETRSLHEELIECIINGDVHGAEASIERHIENARQRSLRLFAMGLL
jgi:DNA-binding GntR family transcriptional regulator